MEYPEKPWRESQNWLHASRQAISEKSCELLIFIRNYDNLSKTLQEDYSENTNLVLSNDDEDEGEEEDEVVGEEPRSNGFTGSYRLASCAATGFFTVTR